MVHIDNVCRQYPYFIIDFVGKLSFLLAPVFIPDAVNNAK